MPFYKGGFRLSNGVVTINGACWLYTTKEKFDAVYDPKWRGKIWDIAETQSVDWALKEGQIVRMPKGVYTGLIVVLI